MSNARISNAVEEALRGAGVTGIVSYGAHIPRMRLQRASILAANLWSNSALKAYGKGERAMCNWDEDSLTMAVEAARRALQDRETRTPRALYLASTTFPFADRQNAGIVAEALNLTSATETLDIANSRRGGTAALISALGAVGAGQDEVLLIAADHRLSKAASPQELIYGDGAGALLLGNYKPLATFLGSHTHTVDFIDQYRGTGQDFDYEWEERWIRDEGYLKIVPQAVKALLAKLGVAAGDVAHFVMPCWLRGVPALVAKSVGFAKEAVADTLADRCGDTGTAHSVLMLIHALERAKPGEKIVVVGFGQGCDVLMFEATDAITAHQGHGVEAALNARAPEANYNKLETFTGILDKEHGKRSEVERQTYLSVLYRNRQMLTGFVGGACRTCGAVQFPKSRFCVNPNCEDLDSQDDHPLAETPGKVVTWTADRLTFDLNPPAYFGLVQFDGGGRLLMDFTDVDEGSVEVGVPMRVQFRIKHFDNQRGFRRYFWKAAPVRAEAS
jgi:3-hydroxy-3-methylglutaryl CoA synthase